MATAAVCTTRRYTFSTKPYTKASKMEPAFLTVFVLLCLFAATRPPVAFALMLHLFSIKQVMQAHCASLRSSLFGTQFVNYAIAATCALAAVAVFFRRDRPFHGLINSTAISILLLFGWSVISLLWSPGREIGLAVVISQLPYFILVIGLSPMLLFDADDVAKSFTWLVGLGVCLCLIILSSNQFTSVYGRLAVDLAAGVRSNSLNLGELGGMMVILAAALRRGFFGPFRVWIRVAVLILGALLALRAGTRGQFFLSFFVAIVMTPVAAPVRNILGFFSTALLVGVVGVVLLALLSTQLEGYEAQRFSLESMLYGQSSASSRATNLAVLAKAWREQPQAYLLGLGYSTFPTLTESGGDPYSHVLFADALFELGLPGAAALGISIFLGIKNWILLFRESAYGGNERERSAMAAIGGLVLFQLLLVNKQGALWGIPPLFAWLLLLARLQGRQESAVTSAEDDYGAAESEDSQRA